MHDDDMNNYKFTWQINKDGSHPWMYSWFNEEQDDLNETNKHQDELEQELAQLDLIDYLVYGMQSFPDADAIVTKIRANIA